MSSKSEAISRTKFLKNVGLSSAAIFAATYCSGVLSSCTNEKETVPPSPGAGLLTIDLQLPEFSKLNTKGEFIIKKDIVVANTSDGNFVAVPLLCSHAGFKEVQYNKTEFICTAHGARFDNEGKGLNANGKNGLKLYKVTKAGNILTIS
jgi:cytochrome b6-f complex iron-sulfur subunit